MMAELIINGETRSFGAGEFPPTVAALLNVLQLDAGGVIVELEGRIVAREEFCATIKAGDRLELVRFVGGG